MMRTVVGVVALTVAVRELPSRAPISPTNAPG